MSVLWYRCHSGRAAPHRLVGRLGMPAYHGQHDEEADDIGQGHVPAGLKLSPYRTGLGEQVRQGDPGWGAGPDHGTAKAHREGQHPQS